MRIGIDIGGTNMVFGVVDDQKELIKNISLPMPRILYGARNLSLDDIIDTILKGLDEITGGKIQEVSFLGIGIPGSVDGKTGIVNFSNTLALYDVKIIELIREKFGGCLGANIMINNDAHCAAIGEISSGSSINNNNTVLITIGTGIGSGIILNGRLYTGINGASELGHSVIVYNGRPCTCGRLGCFETYASATALIDFTKEAMELNLNTQLHAIVKQNGGKVDGKTAFIAARNGDATALNIIDMYMNYLACGVANLINEFQPDKILIGGGVSNEGDYLINMLREKVNKLIFTRNTNVVQTIIERASLGNTAGVIGAALLDYIEEVSVIQ